MKPLIGLTTNFIISNEGPTKGQERYFLVSENVKSIEKSVWKIQTILKNTDEFKQNEWRSI